jgi:hypothetical protein
VSFETYENEQNIILEGLSEMNYKSRVKCGFFDKEVGCQTSDLNAENNFQINIIFI